jgi:hypothetical protein
MKSGRCRARRVTGAMAVAATTEAASIGFDLVSGCAS